MAISPSDSSSGPPAAFPDTRWTLVEYVRHGSEEQRRAALESICRAYWFPLYAFLRKSGRARADAEDRVQSLFEKLLSGDLLCKVEQDGGRLRGWLLRLLRNDGINTWRRETAQRRGGGNLISLDGAEDRYAAIPSDLPSPEAVYDRQWAFVVLERAIDRLREDFTASGRQELFDLLQPTLQRSSAHVNFAEIGARAGITEGHARVSAFRLRKRLREFIESEIAQISGDTADAAAEMESFRSILSGG